MFNKGKQFKNVDTMSIKSTQNHLNKYFSKSEEIRFEEINNIKQTEKQISKKQKVEDNHFVRFQNDASKLTESEYYSLEGVENLCYSYEEMLKEQSYNK